MPANQEIHRTEPQLYEHRHFDPVQNSPRSCHAIRYDGENRLQLARFSQGNVCFVQGARPGPKEHALFTTSGAAALQRISPGDFLVYCGPTPEKAANPQKDPAADSWWSVMNESQYRQRWELPLEPNLPHPCREREADRRDYEPERIMALQYTIGNYEQANRWCGDRLQRLPVYYPDQDNRQDFLTILITPAYQDLAAVRIGDWLYKTIDPDTGETYPEDIDVMPHKTFTENYKPVS